MEAEEVDRVSTQRAQHAGEAVLRRTRTIVLDLEMDRSAAGRAAEVGVLVQAGLPCCCAPIARLDNCAWHTFLAQGLACLMCGCISACLPCLLGMSSVGSG